MKSIVLLKTLKIRKQRLIIQKNNEKIVFDENESKKKLELKEGDTITIKQYWVGSKTIHFDELENNESYEIIPTLNNTWITAIAGIIVIITLTTYPRFHENIFILAAPFVALFLYIYSYLTIFRNRYFKIRKI
jgi:hypothetical protein